MFTNLVLKIFQCRAKCLAVDCLVTEAVLLGKREPFQEFLVVVVHWWSTETAGFCVEKLFQKIVDVVSSKIQP